MFMPHTRMGAQNAPWEYLPAAEGDYQVGQMLNIAAGKLAAISAACTTTPNYLCMMHGTVADGDLIPVIRVEKEKIFETTLSAAAASAVVGTKLQVSAGGLEVDAGAAGTFELTYLDGTAKGDMVQGRFV